MAIRSGRRFFSICISVLIASLILETSRAYAANPVLEISIQDSPQSGIYIDTILGGDITIIPPGSSSDLREAFFTPTHQGIYPGTDRDVYVTPRGNGFADFTVINKTGNAPVNEIFDITVPLTTCIQPSPDRKSFLIYGMQNIITRNMVSIAAIGNFTGQTGTGRRIPVEGVLAGVYGGMQKLMLKVEVPPSQVHFPLTTSFSYVTFFTPQHTIAPPGITVTPFQGLPRCLLVITPPNPVKPPPTPAKK